MLNRNSLMRLVFGCSLVGAGSSVSWAQDASAPVPEASPDVAAPTAGSDELESGEIIVTATRKSEYLSKVPISITALGQADMDKQNVRTINDLARISPGLRVQVGTRRTGGGSNVSIRGIDSSVGAATTGIYIDDTPIQTRLLGTYSQNTYPRIFDLERVEVLRGPQGTLFGAGAQGGIVRFITPQPSLTEFSVYGRGEVSSTEHGGLSYEGGVAAGGPLIADKLGFRVSGWYRRDGGYIDRLSDASLAVVDRDANTEDTMAVRGALTLAPVDGLNITGSVYHQIVDSNDVGDIWSILSDLDEGVFRNQRKFAQPRNDRFTISSILADYDAGPVRLVSNTSWFKRNMDLHIDFSAGSSAVVVGPATNPFQYRPGEYAGVYVRGTQDVFTQELRLQSQFDGPLTFVVGGFYQDAKQVELGNQDDPFLDAVLLRVQGRTVLQRYGKPIYCPGVIPGCGIQFVDNRARDEQKAVFGQIDFKIFDNLTLTAGARYSRIESFNSRMAIGPAAGANQAASQTLKESPFTPKFGVSWQVNSSNLFYAGAGKGFRIGGLNAPVSPVCGPELAALGLPSSPTSFSSDSVWSYELGSKNRLFGNKVRVDASIFRVDWSDIQTPIRLTSCGASQITANLGSARSEGFDLAVDVDAAPGLSIGGTVGYANARLTSTVRSPSGALFGVAGDKIGGSPWTYTLYSEYEHELDAGRSLYFRADLQHTGDTVRPNPVNVGVIPRLNPGESYDLVQLRAGFKAGHVDISAYVANLLDQAPIIYQATDIPASPLDYYGTLRPRTFGLTATYRY